MPPSKAPFVKTTSSVQPRDPVVKGKSSTLVTKEYLGRATWTFLHTLALSYPEVELLYVMNNSDVSAILSTEDHSELMQNIANKTSSWFFFHIPPVPNKSSEKSNNGHSKMEKVMQIEFSWKTLKY